MKGEYSVTIIGDLVIALLLVSLISLGLLPPSEVSSAVAATLVGALFLLSVWGFRQPLVAMIQGRPMDQTKKEIPPTPRAVSAPKTLEENWTESVDEVKVISGNGYTFYPFHMGKKGLLKVNFASKLPIDLTILSGDEFERFEKDKRYDYEDYRDSVKRASFDFRAPKTSVWYVLFENHNKSEAEVQITLKCRSGLGT